MNQWIFFSLLTPFLWGVSMLFDQVIRRHFLKDDHTFAFLGGISRLIIGIIVLTVIGFPKEPVLNIGILMLAGLCWIYPMLPYIKALSFEETSRISIMFQSIPVFTLLLGIFFLNETLNFKQSISFLLILMGGIIAALNHVHKKIALSKALPLMLIASFLFATSDIIFKKEVFYFSSFLSAFGWFSVGCGIAALSLLLLPEWKNKISKSLKKSKTLFWLLVFGSVVTGTGGMASFMYALTLDKVALTSVLVGTQPLFVMALNVLTSKLSKLVAPEKVSPHALVTKFSAFVFIIGGLLILNWK